MPATTDTIIPGALTRAAYEKLAARHARAHGRAPAVIDAQGRLLCGRVHCAGASRPPGALKAHAPVFRQALEETLRWGEPCIMCCPCGNALWAVPVMRNQQTLGALLVAGVPLETTGAAGELDRSLLAASRALLDLAARENLTNTALLRQNRDAALRESGRAEALHDLKERLYDEIRSAYLREEPALLAAIQRGERAEARGIINRVLTAIYARGAGRHSLLKTLSLELVVMMARAAVQAGAEPEKILGLNYRSLTELAEVRSHEDLSRWLCDILEQLIDAIGSPAAHPNAVQLARAIAHVEQHYAGDITRDETARAAGLSPGHFSHLMREHAGVTFTGLLLRVRLDNARRLLARDSASVSAVAQSCGFGDQSYFTRVFKKIFNETPAAYRRRARGAWRFAGPREKTSTRAG